MQFWGIFYPPPPPMSCFFMHPLTLLVIRTLPPSPLRHDVIYGQPLIIWHCIIVEEYCWFVI